MNSSLLALTALVGVSAAFLWQESTPTVVHGMGTVHCDLSGGRWCFQVNLYECDAPLSDERVDSYGTVCTNKPSHDYFFSGTQNGDGGLWDSVYEFQLSITHNCTTKGSKMRKIEQKIQNAATSARDVEIKSWNSSILNVGKPVYNYA